MRVDRGGRQRGREDADVVHKPVELGPTSVEAWIECVLPDPDLARRGRPRNGYCRRSGLCIQIEREVRSAPHNGQVVPVARRETQGIVLLGGSDLQGQLRLTGRRILIGALADHVDPRSVHGKDGPQICVGVLRHEARDDSVIGVEEFGEVEVGVRESAP